MFAATLVVSNSLARRMAFASAQREAAGRAQTAAVRIEGLLASIEARLGLMAGAIAGGEFTAASLDRLLARFVESSPEIHAVTVTLPADAQKAPAGRRAASYRRSHSGAQAETLAKIALQAHGWAEPHQDSDGTWLVTYTTRETATRGAVTASADVSLDFLDAVSASLGAGGGFGVILSRSGRLLAYPHRGDVDASMPVLEELPPDQRARFEPIVKRMLAGGTGSLRVDVQDQAHLLTYLPVGRSGWTLGVLHPEKELFAEVHTLRLTQASLSATGLALLALVVVGVSRRITRPVKALAASASRLGTGDLDTELPPPESRDELGALTQAFHHMRDSLKIHIARLQAATAAKERLDSELRVARRIQADMLPRPEAGGPGQGYELAATLVPARAVGGDLFDHFQTGRRLFFLVGDVSGKGVAAALFMARAKTLFETLAARADDPGALLAELNRGLAVENEAGMYLTAVLGSLDLDTGQLVFAAAGHDPPVLIRSAHAPEALEADGGPMLGLLDGAAYPTNRWRLAPGEGVLLYTDGVPDAWNVADELFEMERLLACLKPLGADSPRAVTDGVLAAVRAFAGEAPQSDDITILTLRYLAG